MEVWKIMFLSKWVIFRFHVNLPGFGGIKERKSMANRHLEVRESSLEISLKTLPEEDLTCVHAFTNCVHCFFFWGKRGKIFKIHGRPLPKNLLPIRFQPQVCVFFPFPKLKLSSFWGRWTMGKSGGLRTKAAKKRTGRQWPERFRSSSRRRVCWPGSSVRHLGTVFTRAAKKLLCFTTSVFASWQSDGLAGLVCQNRSLVTVDFTIVALCSDTWMSMVSE